MSDRNGYVPSILNVNDSECFVCGKGGDLARHEVFFGTAYRQKSKAFGLWVNVCPECHAAIHDRKNSLDRELKETAQAKAMLHYGWSFEQFRERFGKNWL